ncbi:MAG: AEC family transporter [Firmicutes bacterium]|nr:AEC family transporter [Bacillota bacterium]
MIERVISQLITIMILVLAGAALKKTGVLKSGSDKILSGILLKAALPALMIMSFQREYSHSLHMDFLRGALAMFIVMLSAMGIMLILTAKVKTPGRRGVYVMGGMCANVSFMGIPIATAMYGDQASFYCSAVIFAFNVVFFMFYRALLHIDTPGRGFRIKDILSGLKSPVMIGIYIGYFLFLTQIKLPEPLGNALNGLGNVTTPLAMLVVGMTISFSDKKFFRDKYMYISMIMCLLISPVIAKLFGTLLLDDPLVIGVLVTSSAMPAAATVSAVTADEGKDAVLASNIIMLSTIVSVVSIPAVIALLV